MNQSRNLNPTSLSREEIKLIAFQVVSEMKDIIKEFDKPMNGKQAYQWWGISKSTFYKYVDRGVIKGHRLTPDSDETYLRSEIIQAIKNS